MKRFLFAALAAVLGGTLSAHAADNMARGAFVSDCINAAASTYRFYWLRVFRPFEICP